MTSDYPDTDELKKIREWPYTDFKGLMAHVKSLWAFDAWGWKEEDNKYQISTGGWSGNEDLIGALQDNLIFWMMCWVSSRRGGHYEFELPEQK